MNRRNYSLISTGAAFGLALALANGAAQAQQRDEPKLSMEEVVPKMEEKYNGKVTEIELDRERSGDVYEMEIKTTDGYEWDVEVDANTGEVVKEERELDD